jgi:hypothetical protein
MNPPLLISEEAEVTVRRFPYGIFYRIAPNLIEVIAVYYEAVHG